MSANAQQAAPARGGRQRDRTRAAILGAGQRLFADRAFESVTIDEIVGDANVAKGSFYNHFDGKDCLAKAVLEIGRHDCEHRIQQANNGVTHPPLRLVRAMCVVILYAMEHPERLQSLLGLSERNTSYNSPLNLGISADIKQGIADGSLADVDLEAGVLAVIGLNTIAVRHAMAPETKTAPTHIAISLGSALLRALGVEPDQASKIAKNAANSILDEESSP